VTKYVNLFASLMTIRVPYSSMSYISEG